MNSPSPYPYDRNSAPLTITRNGLLSDGVSKGIVDDLKMQYDGNRPVKVTDYATRVVLESSLDFDSPTGRSDYSFDSSGRLTADSGTGITAIHYAPNDMPLSVESSTATISYRYRADGTKLMSSVSSRSGMLYSVQTRYDVGSFRFPQAIGAVEIERINLPWGYIDSKGMPNVYVKDYQGNVRAVYKQYTGQITQQTDYYPYGLPKAKSTKPEANPFKYIGKELTTDLSNPFYDFEARIQLPTLGLFNRPDPKAGDYTSFNTYTYCGGDPVNRVDFDGERPTAYESALMASAVYQDPKLFKDRIEKLHNLGWEISKIGTAIQMEHHAKSGIGLQSMLFEKTDRGVTEYAYVYAGTNCWEDAVEDATQLVGITSQYTMAINNAKKLNEELKGKELTFVGHSLGGSEAAAASMVTGRPAITFNPAVMSPITKWRYGISGNGNITNYISSTPSILGFRFTVDFVTNIQSKIGLSAPGRTFLISVGLLPSHSIEKIVNILENKRE